MCSARGFLTFFSVLCCMQVVYSQDVHFSQPYLNPLAFNPGRTGVFEGKWRANAAYRDQWSAVPVAFRTATAGAEVKLRDFNRGFAAGGFSLVHDQAGDLGLRWLQISLTGSYTQQLDGRNALTVGGGLSLAQRAVDFSNIRVRNQWDGEQFVQGLPTKEPFGSASAMRPSVSGGVNWYHKVTDKRTHVHFGAGGHHLNRPDLSLDENASFNLPVRLGVLFNGAVQLSEQTDAVGYALFQHMQSASEALLGGGVRRVLSSGPANHTALQLTLGVRLNDALVPALALERNNWIVGLGYDLNSSLFDVATRRRGGFELAAVYRNLPVPPVKQFKACPIF